MASSPVADSVKFPIFKPLTVPVTAPPESFWVTVRLSISMTFQVSALLPASLSVKVGERSIKFPEASSAVKVSCRVSTPSVAEVPPERAMTSAVGVVEVMVKVSPEAKTKSTSVLAVTTPPSATTKTSSTSKPPLAFKLAEALTISEITKLPAVSIVKSPVEVEIVWAPTKVKSPSKATLAPE